MTKAKKLEALNNLMIIKLLPFTKAEVNHKQDLFYLLGLENETLFKNLVLQKHRKTTKPKMLSGVLQEEKETSTR